MQKDSPLLFSDDLISPFGPPKLAGVYAVCVRISATSKERIVYIGSSKNIHHRVNQLTHPYRLLFNRNKDWFVYTKSIITNEHVYLEKELIQKYRPLLNIQSKNG